MTDTAIRTRPRNHLLSVAVALAAVSLAFIVFPFLVPRDDDLFGEVVFRSVSSFCWVLAAASGIPAVLLAIFGLRESRVEVSDPADQPVRRNRIAVTATVFASFAIALFGSPFLGLFFDAGSGWQGLWTVFAGYYLAWPATLVVGAVAVVLGVVAVRRSDRFGRRRLATAALTIASIVTAVTLAIETFLKLNAGF